MTELEITNVLEEYDARHKKSESFRARIIEYAFRSILGILVWLAASTYNSLFHVKRDVATLITQRTYSEKDILRNTLELEKKQEVIQGNKDAIILLTEQIKELQRVVK